MSLAFPLITGTWNAYANESQFARYLSRAELAATSLSLTPQQLLVAPSISLAGNNYTKPLYTTAVPIIPVDVFTSYAKLEESFEYLFPYGPFHIGATAYMVGSSTNHDYITLTGNNTLTLTAAPITPAQRAAINPNPKVNYLSGTVYSKMNFTIEQDEVGLDLGGWFDAPTIPDMWPALWFTKTSGWSAEIDVLEWNGDGNVSYNVYNQVGWNQINVPWPAGFHNVTCQVRNINNKDLTVTWWQDGAQVAKMNAINMVGKEFFVTLDFQTGGQSLRTGQVGPTTNTTFMIRELYLNKIISAPAPSPTSLTPLATMTIAPTTTQAPAVMASSTAVSDAPSTPSATPSSSGAGKGRVEWGTGVMVLLGALGWIGI